MNKFRKKPVVIEAVQFTGENYLEVMDWAHEGMSPYHNAVITRDIGGLLVRALDEHLMDIGGLLVRTLEGHLTASPGNWIIKGVKGEFYPCKSDIFEATYERVPDE